MWRQLFLAIGLQYLRHICRPVRCGVTSFWPLGCYTCITSVALCDVASSLTIGLLYLRHICRSVRCGFISLWPLGCHTCVTSIVRWDVPSSRWYRLALLCFYKRETVEQRLRHVVGGLQLPNLFLPLFQRHILWESVKFVYVLRTTVIVWPPCHRFKDSARIGFCGSVGEQNG